MTLVTPDVPEQVENLNFPENVVAPAVPPNNILPLIVQCNVPCASTGGTFVAEAGPAATMTPVNPSAPALSPTANLGNMFLPNCPTRWSDDGAARMGRRLGITAFACALVLTAAACEGTWTKTAQPSPVRAVHAALLHTAKVLLTAGSGNDPVQFAAGTFKTAIYDPTTGSMRSDIATPYDLFCSGHAFLPDGRLLVAGGTTAYGNSTTDVPYKGDKRVRIFDPVTETYRTAPSMAIGRWYPVGCEVGQGRLTPGWVRSPRLSSW